MYGEYTEISGLSVLDSEKRKHQSWLGLKLEPLIQAYNARVLPCSPLGYTTHPDFEIYCYMIYLNCCLT